MLTYIVNQQLVTNRPKVPDETTSSFQTQSSLIIWFKAYFPVMSLSFHFTGPPVNVTCNIFINSFGSVTETTMVSHLAFMLISALYNVSMCYLSLNLQVHQLMLPATYLSTALVL